MLLSQLIINHTLHALFSRFLGMRKNIDLHDGVLICVAAKKSSRSHLEYIVVKEYHNDAGYVETRQARVDDKIRIVEQTLVRYPVRGVIQA